jgi:hypothetical protein
MAVNIGFLHGEPQILEVRGGLVFINDTPQPIKYLTEEQVEDFRKVLDALPPEDAPGASALRAALASCDSSRGLPPEAEAALPEAEAIAGAERDRRVHPEEGLTALLLHRLRTAGPEALSRIYGMDEGLEHRFLRAARKAGTREALLDGVKTKRYTHARLSRVCACTLLGLTKDFAAAHRQPTYARVLGFRKSALPLLHGLRDGPLPLVVKCADADASDPLFALDVLAQDLWALGCENPACRAAGQDYTTSPVRL